MITDVIGFGLWLVAMVGLYAYLLFGVGVW
jgi:hypothetical protein